MAWEQLDTETPLEETLSCEPAPKPELAKDGTVAESVQNDDPRRNTDRVDNTKK